MKNSPRSSHTHCQVAQADSQTKTWQRVCLPHPEKIELKKFPFPSENKKYATAQPNARQISVAMQTQKPLTEKRFNYSVDRRPACNTGLAKCGRTVLKLGFGNSIWLLYLNRRTQPRMPALR
jgi:hypothetical protein